MKENSDMLLTDIKLRSVLESIKNSGNDYVLNIPYHPQTNPIETYFSELKHYIKLDSKIE